MKVHFSTFLQILLIVNILLVIASPSTLDRLAVAARVRGFNVSAIVYLPVIFTQNPPPPSSFMKISPQHGAESQIISLTLDWSDSSTATLYLYCYDATNDEACSNWIPTGFSQATIEGLSFNTSYYWQVKARNSGGDTYADGNYSAYWSFRTASQGEVPAGEFQMGCDQAHSGYISCSLDELPLHTVYLDAFYIDPYEVTNAQFAQCVAAGACNAPTSVYSRTRSYYYGNPEYAQYPIIFVSWYDASDYCAWAGKRLPTEAEWEKAARGASDTRPYPWGEADPTCGLANIQGSGHGCGPGDTTQVGSYPDGASPYGVMDLMGNVWEWVNDRYQSDYYSISPDMNPPGPTDGIEKVLRGGAWSSFIIDLGVANRNSISPESQYDTIGFRCAYSVEP